jgi:hypothetical protein
MSNFQKYGPFFASALLMCVVLFFIYPHYQYYVDPDGTAYLTISQRYANGDYARAINGYWSPWSCWLTALLIKGGLAAIPASVVINAIGAVGFLFISQSFFLKFGIERKQQWLLNITLALFLCFAVFHQSFDDLWECFFLLSTLRVIVADGFKNKPMLWVLCGFIGALAYFAKAYSFPFFILNTVVCTYFLSKDNKVQWLKISVISIAVMVVCASPWIWALHNKYGIWTTSTSGSLNMSWYLVGHPYWKDGIGKLLPPAYPDSPYYWEDPWFVNGPTPHFWNSWHLFGLQFLRIGLNIWKFIVSNLQLSVFFIAIVGYVKWKLFWKRDASDTVPYRVIMISFFLFILGYLPINFEARYLWYMVPLGMVVVGVIIQEKMPVYSKRIAILLFCGTFLVYPLWEMRKMFEVGKADYEIATELRRMNVHGSFACAAAAGKESQRIERIAYFSGNTFYSVPGDKIAVSFIDLLPELRRYHVDYYLIYDDSSYAFELGAVKLRDEAGNPFPSVYIDLLRNGGVKVFTISK